MSISKADIEAAALRIKGHVRVTPVMTADLGAAGPVTFKLEQLQLSGSFKTRGAFNSLLSQKVPASGVVAASGGNHGAAVALAATALGHKAAIFVPTFAPATKVERIKAFGGEAVVIGDNFSITQAAASERATSTGALMVHAYDQPATLAGQGTLAKEFMEQAPGLDAILVAVGGGGLIGGMALWCHAAGGPKIIAVEPEGAANFHAARQAGHPVDIKPNSIAADSLGPPTVGKLMFDQANDKIAEAVLVEDKAIKEAQRLLWRDFRIVVEPGGATALAALLSGRYQPKAGARIGVLLCGGNCDPATVV